MNPTSTGIGFSHHSVPSLSYTATRSATGMKSGLPSVVTASVKERMAARVAVSFQEERTRSVVAGLRLFRAVGATIGRWFSPTGSRSRNRSR